MDLSRHFILLNNPTRNEETGNGLLAGLYNKVNFIDDKTAAVCYLNPDGHKPSRQKHADLIYPFGCNASQKRAVSPVVPNPLLSLNQKKPSSDGHVHSRKNGGALIICCEGSGFP